MPGKPVPSPHQLICRALRRDWWAQLLASLGLTLAGLIMIWAFFRKQTILTGFGLVFFVLGIRLVSRMSRQRKLTDLPLYQTLEFHPRKIVWVYGVITQRMPFGFEFARQGLIYFKLIDGNEHTLSLAEKEIPGVLNYLSERLPQATFGYTKDREQWYMAAPELLIRHPGEDEE
jgi:hypothetical protein